MEFCCYQPKIQKMRSHLRHFYDQNFGSKHDNQTNDPVFSSTFWALLFGIFHFCISIPSNFSSMGPPLHMFWSVKYTFTRQRWHFHACQHRWPFSTEEIVNFWYITCFVHSLILTWPQSHGLKGGVSRDKKKYFLMQTC